MIKPRERKLRFCLILNEIWLDYRIAIEYIYSLSIHFVSSFSCVAERRRIVEISRN